MINDEVLVTTALPYANGPIHLGHLLEQIQADVWVRSQRMQGRRVHFISAEDTHGTAIMLKAEQLQLSPEVMLKAMKKAHERDFAGFNIAFDYYHSTHSADNRLLAETLYKKLCDNGHIILRKIIQLYDPDKALFLPDRFVKGGCPQCQSPDQYGDTCEVCGAAYAADQLISPQSTLSNATPVLRETEHFFFDLPRFSTMLQEFIASDVVERSIGNKLKEWFLQGLQPWDITRDAPYFGFEIPDAPGKYFYVWLDAPIGYMSTLKAYADTIAQPELFDRLWQPQQPTEVRHFIGKDIIYFHALFWPALLKGTGFRLPTKIVVHGHVTINGKKMSKSKGTFIEAATYLEHLPSDALRYYYATKLSERMDDIDLNFDDFIKKVNGDLVNKVVNLASRTIKFIADHFSNRLADALEDEVAYRDMCRQVPIIFEAFAVGNYQGAMRYIMQLADTANQYIDQKAPWVLATDPAQKETLHRVCSTGIHFFKVLMTCLKPVTPQLAAESEAFLGLELTLPDLEFPMYDHELANFKPLFTRITADQVTALNEARLTVS